MVPEQDFRNTRFEKQNFSKFVIFQKGDSEKMRGTFEKMKPKITSDGRSLQKKYL